MTMNNNTVDIYSPASFLKEEIRCDFKVTERRKRLWQMQLDMLQLVDTICNKYSIKYFAIGGTLLGAIRHKGYIPWDDDIDLAMFRSDYEQFVQAALQEIKYPYFVQSPTTEEDYAISHIKIRNSNSVGATKYDFEFKYNKGVFIDIFPLDNIPDDSSQKQQLLNGVHDYRKTLDVGARHFWYWQGTIKGAKNILSEEEKNYYISLVKERSIPTICDEYKSFCTQYNNTDTEYCGFLGLELTSERFFWKRDCFSGQTTVPFEYLKIPCPSGYDEILKKTYGNYSVFERTGSLHGTLIFEPDISYKDYILSDSPSFLL